MSNIIGFIRRDDVAIVWTVDDDDRVDWVGVHLSSAIPEDVYYDCCSGCSYVDWCQGEAWLTPEGTYILLESQGFADCATRHAALLQFRQIEGCEWAGIMADALDHRDDEAV